MVATPSPVRDRRLVCCAFCARVRSPDGRWVSVPGEVVALFVGNVSHTYCPECLSQ